MKAIGVEAKLRGLKIIADSTNQEKWMFVACDHGPRQTLQPLSNAVGQTLLSFNGPKWESPVRWLDFFRQLGIRGVVCGTSESQHGAAVEISARLAAAELQLPVVVIEDFPGNYKCHEMAAADLLVVESEFSERLYRTRWGPSISTICIPSARYDALRKIAITTPVPVSKPYKILWVGQPETDSCLATLVFAANFLQEYDVRLLFRAHPRDSGYPDGRYKEFLDSTGICWTDVTVSPIESLFSEDIHLTLTHFSSMAVQFGFLGVPTVNILLPKTGGADLQQLKGYPITAACEYGAAFLIRDSDDVEVLKVALLNQLARSEVLHNFDRFYDAHNLKTSLFLRVLEGILPDFFPVYSS